MLKESNSSSNPKSNFQGNVEEWKKLKEKWVLEPRSNCPVRFQVQRELIQSKGTEETIEVMGICKRMGLCDLIECQEVCNNRYLMAVNGTMHKMIA